MTGRTTASADIDRPPTEPVLVEVPDKTYLMIDGSGGPMRTILRQPVD